MAGSIITITSGKGGVGKTTTVANLASALALTGKRIIVVDGDIGLRNLDLVLGLENRIVYDLVDVVQGHCELEQALVRDPRFEALYLLAAAQTRDKTDVQFDEMMAVCVRLANMADYVLIDSPAGIEHGFQNAIAPSERVLIVTTSDVSALRDADKVIYLLEKDWGKRPGLILNRYNAKLARLGEIRDIDDVLDILAIDLIGVVPDDQNVMLSTDRGTPAVLHKRLFVNRAYKNIAQRLMGKNVPLMRFEQPRLVRYLYKLFGWR